MSAGTAVRPPASVARQTIAALRAKLMIACNGIRRAVDRSPLRVAGMGLMVLGTAVVAFAVFSRAFAYLAALEVVGPVILVRLLSLFFFALFVMLVMSNVVVAFQSLFRSREADWWATAPVAPSALFHLRSVEIAVMSSWAFLFLGVPMLVAFGVGTSAPWRFHALVPVVLLLFVACAHSLGLALTVVLVRLFPGIDMKRLVVLLAASLVPIVVALARAFRMTEVGRDDDVSELLVHVLEGLGRTQYPLLPGYWAAEALRAAALGDLGRAGLFTWTLFVSATFFTLLAREACVRWLTPAYQLLRGAAIERPVARSRGRRLLAPARGPLRALASKDVTLFLREPAQWAQVLLVGVLGAVYVANLRTLPDLSRIAPWGPVASYLNLGVVLLLLSTLTTRFAFPLVSMEGRRAWIVLLAPMPRASLVRQKMILASVLSCAFALAAAHFSTTVLGVDPRLRLVTIASSVAGAVALSGLAVGLGALVPDFKEDNAARIVTGFGGTLDFLLGLAYVAATTVALAAPSFLEASGRIAPSRRDALDHAAWAAVALLSLATAAIPLALGKRHLEQLEL